MNALLIAVTLAAPQTDDSATRIAAMLNVYHGARTLGGDIEWVQAAQNVVVTTKTKLQIDRDGRKVYLDQVRQAPSGSARWTVTANGKVMTYPNFEGAPGSRRLKESMILSGATLTEKDVIEASSRSLGDRDIPLNIMFGRTDDLKRMRWQMRSLSTIREETLGEEKLTVVGGTFMENDAASPARYEFWLTSKNELRRFQREESTRVPLETAVRENTREIYVTRWSDPVVIVNRWNVKIEVGGKLDERLFEIIN